MAQNEATGNAPSASVSQSDPSDRLRVQTRYLVNFLAPSVFWTRGLDRRDGCPALRNRLFPLLCLSHPNHIIYRFTSPATGARVSAAGKRHQQPETEIKRKYHAYYFFWKHGFVFIVLQLRDFLTWYSVDFKDPMVVDPPEWFKSFIFCEAVVQLPFFPVAAYAFLKGQFYLTVSQTLLHKVSF